MARYAYIDQNLYAHIRSLRAAAIVLAAFLAVALGGWWYASGVQRLSLPPLLEYGAVLESGRIEPWEVYNFCGFIWQLLNRCESDCSRDLEAAQNRLAVYITPEFRAWLANDRDQRQSELRGRTRYLLPENTVWDGSQVSEQAPGRWKVNLDVQLVEHIGGSKVKDATLRYTIVVISRRIDPEFNPWGLYLDGMASAPRRLDSK